MLEFSSFCSENESLSDEHLTILMMTLCYVGFAEGLAAAQPMFYVVVLLLHENTFFYFMFLFYCNSPLLHVCREREGE